MFLNPWHVGILEHWVPKKKKKHKQKIGIINLRTTSHLHKSKTDESKITMLYSYYKKRKVLFFAIYLNLVTEKI